MTQNRYERLAKRLSKMGMGFPFRQGLIDILRETYSPVEVEAALLLPIEGNPLEPASLDDLSIPDGRDRGQLETTLEELAERGMIFSRELEDGQTGYALHQFGFGIPQTYFWKGEDTPHARKMSQLMRKYLNTAATTEVLGAATTKPWRYVPINKSLTPETQAVYPSHMMETVIANATTFAVAHCPCRVAAGLAGRSCEHPLEVCLKFDEMAQFVIDRGLARKVTREEALQIIAECADGGLVHFVDNADGKVKHNCNCCGCCCWNVGSIRRRKIPRDVLMATYFLRETAEELCVGCGACEASCPVDAISMDGATPVIDQQWCIGCGVCANPCDFDAVRVQPRSDRPALPKDFDTLHASIRADKAGR